MPRAVHFRVSELSCCTVCRGVGWTTIRGSPLHAGGIPTTMKINFCEKELQSIEHYGCLCLQRSSRVIE